MFRTSLTTRVLTFSFAIWLNACKTTTPPPVSLPAVGQGIVAWGDNRSGQLGDGSTAPNRAYWGVVNLDGAWNAIAAGGGHTLVLKTDGTVWAWGENGKGQLGIGTTSDAHTPYTTQISNVAAIAAGGSHSLALSSDGTVWAWGLNDAGQLGNGTNADATSPVQVKGFFLVRAVAIAAGENHSLAVDGNGEVWAWGKNTFGQLGDSSMTDRSAPVKVKQLNNVVQVAAGANHSLALKNDGSVWAWGDHRHLQLGNGTLLSPSLTPIRVPTGLPTTPQPFLSDVKAIAAGGDHSLALTNGNEVWGWGSDKFAESSGVGGGLGAVAPLFPQSIQGITGKVIAIAAGTNHSLALTDDGRVWAWGHNDQGQLGDSTLVDPFAVHSVKNLHAAKAIAAGGAHSTALAVSSLKVDHTTLSFGNVQVNNSATLTVTVSNDGAAPVNINSFVSSNPAEFAVTSNCTTPVKLAVAAVCAIEVTFRPSSTGNRTATLFINNDSPGGNLQVALSGNGTP
jgi:alpha-tubulin suppressor-like RCC1 family protein